MATNQIFRNEFFLIPPPTAPMKMNNIVFSHRFFEPRNRTPPLPQHDEERTPDILYNSIGEKILLTETYCD